MKWAGHFDNFLNLISAFTLQLDFIIFPEEAVYLESSHQ